MENELSSDIVTALKGMLDVARKQQAQIESLHRIQSLMLEMIASITKAVAGDEAPGAPHLALNVEAMQRDRAEIAELERLFKSEPPASGDPS
jgi:hypothetical protein